MIAIAADRSFPRIEPAPYDRTGSLRSIGDIVGELLSGYDLAESAPPAAVVFPTPVGVAVPVDLATPCDLLPTGALASPELALSR
jgi:hypothetical protein